MWRFAIYMWLVVCAQAVTAQSGAAPKHMVAFMTAPSQTSCPAGWQEFSYAQGRVILGVTTPALAPSSGIPAVLGTPMADGTPPSHSHTFSIDADVGLKAVSQGVYTHKLGKSGKYPTKGETGAASANLPFIQFLVCEKVVDPVSDSVPFYSYAFFNLSECPAGWAADAKLNGRFVLPMSPGNTPGAVVGDAWTDGTEPPHDHKLKTTIDLDTVSHHSHTSGSDGFAHSGKQDVSGNSDGSTALPFVRLLLCTKGGSAASGEAADGGKAALPDGLLMFSPIADCTTLGDRWVAPIGAYGRFLVGIGGTGTQGLTFPTGVSALQDTQWGGHDHGFAGSVEVGSKDDKHVTNGFYTSKDYGKEGTYKYKDNSDTFVPDLPYVTLRACALQ